MYVRCTHCGYDNSPEYRFCGMCGASLAHPPAAQAAPAKEPPRSNAGNGHTENVHGPSFLGLAEDPKVEFHYLYEDEQPRSHVSLIVFVIILLGAGGFLSYQWRNNGFPFNRLNAASSNSGGQASASPSEVAPAQNQDQQTHIEKPMTGVGDVLPTQPDQNAQAQAPNKPTETDIPPPNSAPGQAQAQGSAAAPNSAASQSANSTPGPAANTNQTQNAAAPKTGQKTTANTNNPTEEANATPPAGVSAASRVAKEPARARTPKPTPSRQAQAAAADTAPDSDLELSGERYLYGNGVPQNCARAETNLHLAAQHGNSKAQTVLGTMYATGHCVGRDLPTAYRWFARALHEEPQNSRISADLQVLWRQMTPQEKQLAIAGGQ
jgi:zinc-ribbon domain/Sel1 repeat